ncbi:SDR family NAD(P)-dependent oxidoreductase [Archaeoglobus veneficus]|uniref:3-oxoacyl-(Acyl-carrier-protein) reductase n=1 Tax=Archaeoglobus veneficus (strain DSM 11195 / SNP6) TaxID=693661 RepID=F2KRC5_ARCVS|nr:SDR family oxidoreductase [Archaeoglobus veneficus]AEA47859.1 3-oxoacyl-(acyl-carrier-protein) reductase [Archaeoglobus veneficus SNP6]
MLVEKMEKMGLSPSALAGKVAVITGAGRGIGKELARALAWLGAKVVIAEIRDTGAEVEALIRSEGGMALFVRTDVGDEESIKRLANKVFEEFGKVDILINNATVVKTGSILELPLEEWDQTWSINVRAAILTIKAFLPGMLEREEGVIVTITSDEGMPYVAPYSASKAVLSSLGLSLAAELGNESGISVFVFAPGMVDTPGIRNAARELAPRYGMTYEEFIDQSVNPGYDGLMPAEDCAAGFAYCIVNAQDYHGQIADPFQPLAKAGLLSFSSQQKSEDGSVDLSKTSEKVSRSESAVELARELKKILEDVNRETNELDMFRKMWVTRTFRKRCGMGIKDWLETITELISELEEVDQAIETGDTAKAEGIRGNLTWMKSNLEKLADYFKKNMKDAEGYFKDPKALSAALDVLAYRENTVRLLILELEQILE